MENEIHGHAVLEILIEFKQPLTKEKLIEVIATRFGKSTLFYTCSKSGMTAGELIDFFDSKDKFISTGNGLSTNSTGICRHEITG